MSNNKCESEIEVNSDRRVWHYSRSVSVPLLILLLTNIMGGIWWGATLQANETAHYMEMKARTSDRISKSEAEDKLKQRDIYITNNTKNIDQLHDFLEKMDFKLDEALKVIKKG